MKRSKSLVAMMTVGVSMLVTPAARAAAPTYVWSIDGSIANSGLPAGLGPGIALGPNASSTKDGTRLEIAGSGKFTPRGHWIDGSGDYRVLGPNGKVLKAGRWKPVRLTSYRDLGTEPEGSPIEQLRAGIILAPVSLDGVGDGTLAFYCGAHSSTGEEVEGVRLAVKSWRFEHIDAGSTTIET
jgi:hypothetical protein